ncbi:hypothetical protein HKT18_12850 [Flavobacterium sp. IMCC34852]|uniref:histidine kinase n=1 Tax=Flavobacterium rivulicola TaxID=2732161 RepID=A0A7Y3RAX4_9FLAO|nr:two-component regulator propeller domain-containing protein [Flavobacterium sp. IMCC34852]NNT73106.1 hypothetical protein [Flavobacterium sp. IMCC34852]
MLQKITFIAFLLGFTISLQSQNADYIFKNYDTQDGLCDNNINSILEDQKGFIWIGTREGLSRFDGAEFHNFYFAQNQANSESYSWLHNLDYNRILLLVNYKLSVLNTTNQTLSTVQHFKDQKIIGIKKLNANLFALNLSDHFILINNQLKKVGVIKLKGKIYNHIFIESLSDNRLIIGNCFDYYQYDLSTQKLSTMTINMKQYQRGNFGLFELKFVDVEDQKIYIGDYFSGLYVFDYKGKLLRQFKYPEVSSPNFITFLKDRQKALWIGTYKGINRLKNGKIEVIRHFDENDLSLKSDLTTSFLLDRNNNIWVGTNQGLSVYKSKSNSNVKKITITNPSELEINTIAFAGNELFAGSYLGKIYKINPETKKINVLNTEIQNWGIYPYNEKLYISGAHKNNEVWYYDLKTRLFSKAETLKKQFPITDIITLVFQHSNGDFWYSGNAGGGFVRKLAQNNKLITYYKDDKGNPLFASSYYSNVFEDADKNLWFGVNRSNLLLQWNYKTNTFKEINFNDYKEDKNYFIGGITGLKKDRSNFIWVSFEGGGIVKYNPRNHTIKNYNLSNGLNSNYIGDIEFDNQDRLWVLTSKGVGCLDTKTNIFYPMDIWNGFTDNPTNYSMLKMNSTTNKMWIGAKNKLYCFDPDIVLKEKRISTKIYLEYLRNNKINADISKHSFDFNPNENNLEFRLVAVDIETGKNLEYSYQLKGLSHQWHDIKSNRTIFFQKLKAGTYTFNARVRSKGSQEWIYLSKPYSFTIAEYWYQTWWFILLSSILFAMLVWYVIAFNFKKRLEKQKAVEEERNRIAADMHDDLGSGLTKITYLSQMALQKEDNKSLLTNIKNTSTELVESMSEIIWAMKEENNSWEELLSYIKLYAQEYCENNQLTVTFDYPDDQMNFKIIGEVRRHIFLSVKECLHNIVKHSEAKKVTITIQKNNFIIITIHDDGKGINSEQGKVLGGNGLKNIRQRMEKIKAQFDIQNNHGTTVLFKIPY